MIDDKAAFLHEEAKDLWKEIENYQRFHIQQIFLIGESTIAGLSYLFHSVHLEDFAKLSSSQKLALIMLLILLVALVFFYFWQILGRIDSMRRYLEILEKRFLSHDSFARKSLFRTSENPANQVLGWTGFELNHKHRHWFRFNDPLLNLLAMIYAVLNIFYILVWLGQAR